MRLVCPNCDAKYEVPEDAIPETGRDVQCANCGHAWYQMRPKSAEPLAAAVAAAVTAPVTAPVMAPAAAPVTAPAAVAPPVVETAPEPVVEETPDPVPEPVVEAAVAEPMVEMPRESEVPPEVAAESPVETAMGPEVDAIAEVPEPAGLAEAIAAAGTALEEMTEASAASVDAAVAPVAEAVAEVGDAVMKGPEAVSEAVSAAIAEVVPETVADASAAMDTVEVDEIDAAEEVPASVGMVAAAGVSAYAVDESVLAILREEAEREAQARKAEAAKPLETQTDLGIDSAMAAPRKAVDTTPNMAPVDRVSGDEVADDRMATRRTRLPDVEEINSTLRPSEAVEAAEAAAPAPVEARSGFRSGFLMVMTVAILGSAIYSSADAIGHAVPALEGPLKAYVSVIDSLRLKLDGLMQSATVAINGT